MTATPETEHPPFARARMAAGALFVDDQERVLLVRPTYKDYWEIPGGYIEPGEAPLDACFREVYEELGIRPSIGGLLSVDWAPHPAEGDKVLFVFDGGMLTDEDQAQIRFRDGELDRYMFATVEQLPELTVDRLARRLRESLTARRSGVPAYLERGAAPRIPNTGR